MNTAEHLWDAAPAPPEESSEQALWQAFRHGGSAAAREKLFSLHFDFAKNIARRHWLDRRSGDIEFQELSQLAATGLLEALDRFDPELGTPFPAFASRRISGCIIDGIGKMSEVREQISFRNRIRAERARSLAPVDGEALAADEALRALTELAVGLALGFMLDDAGVYVPDGERDRRASAYESLAWKETIERLLTEMSRLPPRERLIIRHHYVSGLTFDQIGAVLGVTKGRVSQLHQASLVLLRKRMRNPDNFKLER